MQTIRNLILSLAFCFLSVTFAHPGGHGPEKLIRCESNQGCTRAEAERAGSFMIEMLTAENQLEQSWATAKRIGNAREASVNETAGWVVEYHNPAIADKTTQNLYIVIAKDGYLLGTTFDKSKFTEKGLPLQLTGIAIIIGLALLGWFVFLRKPKTTLAT